jgi:phi13 family phage major tail protein
MANIGMRNLKYAILKADGSYETPVIMGAAIGATVTLNVAEASLYGDDHMIEYASAIQNAGISLTVDDDDDTVFAELLGKTIDPQTNIVSSSINDAPPYVGFGYIVNKVKNGVQKWRAQFFQKVQFKPFIPESATKGKSLEFKTVSVDGTSVPNSLGVWEAHIDVATEAAAITALGNFFSPQT